MIHHNSSKKITQKIPQKIPPKNPQQIQNNDPSSPAAARDRDFGGDLRGMDPSQLSGITQLCGAGSAFAALRQAELPWEFPDFFRSLDGCV